MYKRLFVVCLAVLLFAGIAVAQRTTGVIAGQVTDPQGLAVPSAKVTVSDEATGFKRAFICGLHDAGTTARNHGKALLRETTGEIGCMCADVVIKRHSRTAKKRHS